MVKRAVIFFLVYFFLVGIFWRAVETYPSVKRVTEVLSLYSGYSWVLIWVIPFIVTAFLFLGGAGMRHGSGGDIGIDSDFGGFDGGGE
ncbi:hypothetical protein UR09_05960 [Candidatus Nitromaritima sp. SCGC AAA799-A02]|nr:hypothetical protein UR09_05960 [Candidatus Nitromaritima sp. SCGC AAA799-A02]